MSWQTSHKPTHLPGPAFSFESMSVRCRSFSGMHMRLPFSACLSAAGEALLSSISGVGLAVGHTVPGQ